MSEQDGDDPWISRPDLFVEPPEPTPFFPMNVQAWDELWRNPQAAWPWPYTPTEIAAINASFAADLDPSLRTAEVVQAARVFLHAKALNRKFGPKPNVPREIARLRQASRDFVEAVRLTSGPSRQAAGLAAGRPADALLRLSTEIDLLQHHLPRLKQSSGGRSKDVEEQELIWALQHVFQITYSIGAFPFTWDEFISVCTDPLGRFSLPDGSRAMTQVGSSAWRSRLARANKRRGGAQNQA